MTGVSFHVGFGDGGDAGVSRPGSTVTGNVSYLHGPIKVIGWSRSRFLAAI